MLETIASLDRDLFLFLNGLHADWLDPIMYFISGKVEWIPLYILLIGVIIYKYKWKSIPILLAVGLTFFITDRFTAGFMKPFFERLRPSHNPELAGLIHYINGYKGGIYGFASSHAASTFGLAMILWMTLKKDFKWIKWLFLWAAVVSYSRIYLGVHYPGDIFVGMIVGLAAGYIVSRIFFLSKEIFSLQNK